MRTRTYSELVRFDSFADRFDYLMLGGIVGRSTFGFDRYLNQHFYRSFEWRSVREFVITRDNGCDLGVPGMDIYKGPLVHHMNPMTVEDVIHHEDWILDPEFLITTTQKTHNDIHYGYSDGIPRGSVERAPGDTRLW